MNEIKRLKQIMRTLRDPIHGCPWDKEQNFETIAPYTIEEAYEVQDAIQRKDYNDLKDELGDLLLQIIFHSQMADEMELFDFDDVVKSISDKMERRHPHIFGDIIAHNKAEIKKNWEDIKASERQAKQSNSAMPEGALSGVAMSLPALSRAEKIQKRAARIGFDWQDSSGPKNKIFEEINEFEEAMSVNDKVDEAGDILFSVVNWLRFQKIDPEAALRQANYKFQSRFEVMEQIIQEEYGVNYQDELKNLSPDKWEEYWNFAKIKLSTKS
ncbi:nucleoside triphosphate pyrophosphohydrolase [Sphingorhabdus lutea]|nr:nucleoside triphosphate pyrophosphohydrolase [Sphingorhabdus lutea]